MKKHGSVFFALVILSVSVNSKVLEAAQSKCSKFLVSATLAASVSMGALSGTLPFFRTSSAQDQNEQSNQNDQAQIPAEGIASIDSLDSSFGADDLALKPSEERAVQQGLEYLRRTMNAQGYWDEYKIDGETFSGQVGNYSTAQTALAGLAFVANGSTPQTGPYQKEVTKILHYLLDEEQKAVRAGTPGLFAIRDYRKVYGQGYSMLFLSQVLGMVHDQVLNDKIHQALSSGVAFLVSSQSNAGGWYYLRYDGDLGDEGSTTVSVVEALRATKDAGVQVPNSVIDRAIQYLKDSQVDSGGLRYSHFSPSVTEGVSVAGMTVFHSVGDYGSPEYLKLKKYVNTLITERTIEEAFCEDWRKEYNLFYFTQALYQWGNPYWKQYREPLFEILTKDQHPSGYWESYWGRVFGTSMRILSLSVPKGYLPIFQR